MEYVPSIIAVFGTTVTVLFSGALILLTISQVLKLFEMYHLLGFNRNTLGYKLYLVEYVQQVPFFHNIHYSLSYPDPIKVGNIWSLIPVFPKFFGIHLSGFH